MDNARKNRLVLALQKAVVATFSESDWRELAYATNARDVVENHYRLLRALSFGDEDYDGHVLTVLDQILACHRTTKPSS